MKPVEQIEASLERMVPVALSQRASRELDEMIDTLAIQTDGKTPGRWRAFSGWSAVAAALAIGVFSTWKWMPWRTAPPHPDAQKISMEPKSGVELLKQTNLVGETEDAGMLADSDGGMLRVLRYQVVEEEFIRDKRSGMTVRVTEPREETVLIPVTSF
jgi:hypothetical protein